MENQMALFVVNDLFLPGSSCRVNPGVMPRVLSCPLILPRPGVMFGALGGPTVQG
jgi:hypothetical protein